MPRRTKRRRIRPPPSLDARSLAVLAVLHGRVPPAIFDYCRAAISAIGLCTPIDALELFAGRKAVTRGFRLLGHVAVAFERRDDPSMDFLTPCGFLQATCLALSLRTNGFLLAAPVCSSWVWLSRSVTRRSTVHPLGLGSNAECVEQGNEMVAKLAVLLLIVQAFDVLWVVEQPSGSLLQLHPRMQYMLSHVHVVRSSWCMADFGGKTLKPTWLYSNASLRALHEYQVLRPPCAGKLAINARDAKTGKIRVTGDRAKLKESQAYPTKFGEAMAQTYRRWRSSSPCMQSAPVFTACEMRDEWGDAVLDTILRDIM